MKRKFVLLFLYECGYLVHGSLTLRRDTNIAITQDDRSDVGSLVTNWVAVRNLRIGYEHAVWLTVF